jgi:hypothetical protein
MNEVVNTGVIQQLQKQLCDAQFGCCLGRIVPVTDELLMLIVMTGALVVGWIVLRRKRQDGASGYDGSPGADYAGGDASGQGWFDGHSHSGDHGGASGDAGGGSDGGGSDDGSGGGGGDSGGGD